MSEYHPNLDGPAEPYGLSIDANGSPLKMAGLLRKKDLIRTGNAGVDPNGVIVDMRENPNAVRLPPHNSENLCSSVAKKSL